MRSVCGVLVLLTTRSLFAQPVYYDVSCSGTGNVDCKVRRVERDPNDPNRFVFELSFKREARLAHEAAVKTLTDELLAKAAEADAQLAAALKQIGECGVEGAVKTTQPCQAARSLVEPQKALLSIQAEAIVAARNCNGDARNKKALCDIGRERALRALAAVAKANSLRTDAKLRRALASAEKTLGKCQATVDEDGNLVPVRGAPSGPACMKAGEFAQNARLQFEQTAKVRLAEIEAQVATQGASQSATPQGADAAAP